VCNVGDITMAVSLLKPPHGSFRSETAGDVGGEMMAATLLVTSLWRWCVGADMMVVALTAMVCDVGDGIMAVVLVVT
jgi:hypothetical protein